MTTPLIDKSAKVLKDVEGLTRSPAALLLPVEARRLIRELSCLVYELAVEVEACKTKALSS